MAETDSTSLAGFAKEETFSDAAKFLSFLGSERFRSGRWVFRGQRDAAWELQPTLERFAVRMAQPRMASSIESDHVREFCRRARHYMQTVTEDYDLLDWLALMRHHGSPSRLLDFTRSPYVAAFFATAEAERNDSAAVWAIDALALKRCSAAVLSKEYGARYVAIGKRCLADVAFSFSDKEVFATLIGGLGRMALVPVGIGPIPTIVFPVDPRKINERMLLQQGLFLSPASLNCSFQASLKSVLEWGPKIAGEGAVPIGDVVFKLVVQPPAHPQVLRELHRMGLSYASLTPGPDGLARSLATVSKIRAVCVPPGQGPDWDFDMAL
jgi:hypothetical protein